MTAGAPQSARPADARELPKAAVRANIEPDVRPCMRLFGFERPVEIEGVDTIVLACTNAPEAELMGELQASGIPFEAIGDCLNPRTREEAVYEGLKAGSAV